MGLFDYLSDALSSLPFSHDVDAESVRGGASSGGSPAGAPKEGSKEADVNAADAKSGGDDSTGHLPGSSKNIDTEAEEDEDDEPKDVKEELEEECAQSKQCGGYKHHYDECVERVTGQIENEGKANEDCVEEFFHLAHCATQCAAPKLWKQLK
ncbi:Non-heme 11 kDa protein of cytochrome bc1 complex [Trichodelitschia bisporula]|uniref:Cytochrome b-c1 complex subunit 6, mitochondrial n=1 Tax=Trichodelitschia bisporula TaxID=703511 RepID=A0A6G1HXW8_9PEZI|nr:Non-heme 11 kDa protein of cytochrome bc1 complex [Trichodelitschia bisporula]